jgi:DNA-binding transcriptional ArsR family regulator
MKDPERRLTQLESVFAALAHASRRQILMVIWFRGGQMGSGEIAGRFHHAWPTISRHLRVLEEAGLVIPMREGRERRYRLDLDKLELVRGWLRWFEGPSKAPAPKTRVKKMGLDPRILTNALKR